MLQIHKPPIATTWSVYVYIYKALVGLCYRSNSVMHKFTLRSAPQTIICYPHHVFCSCAFVIYFLDGYTACMLCTAYLAWKRSSYGFPGYKNWLTHGYGISSAVIRTTLRLRSRYNHLGYIPCNPGLTPLAVLFMFTRAINVTVYRK